MRFTTPFAALLSIGFSVTVFAAPAAFYTDLARGPNSGGENSGGAYVTIFGSGFGATQGSVTVGGGAVAGYKSWSDSKIVIQLGSASTTGNIVVKNTAGESSNGLQFTVGAGTIRIVTTSTFDSQLSAARSGDILYLRAGTYNGSRHGATWWGSRNVVLGSSSSGVAFVAYPGETATVGDWGLTDGGSMTNLAHDVTIANFTVNCGWDCVFGGSYWESEESGAKGGRVVNNSFIANYGSNNTMTGMVHFGGDNWKILGNSFKNNAPTAINNNHAVYGQVGADDAEVAWNRFTELKLGHVIQFHNDGTARLYERLSIHDNEFIGNNDQDMRGINLGNVDCASTASIYNNLLVNVGQNFSGIAVTCGNVVVEGNTLAKISAPSGAIAAMWSTGSRITVRNNIVTGAPAVGASNGASTSQITSSGTQTDATFDSKWRPTNPKKGVAPTFATDHAGNRRSSPATIGAYETDVVAAAPTPNPPSNLQLQ